MARPTRPRTQAKAPRPSSRRSRAGPPVEYAGSGRDRPPGHPFALPSPAPTGQTPHGPVRRIVTGLAALVATVVLLVGPPVLLAWLVVADLLRLPDHVPGWAEIRDRLLGPSDDAYFVAVAAFLLAAAWAALVFAFLLEVTALIRRRPLRRVRGLRGPQLLAGALIAAVLLLAQIPHAPRLVQVVGTGTAPRPTAVVQTVSAAPATAGQSTYVVAPGDTLSGIAARFLGDKDAYPRLLETAGLSNPDLLHVGETVILPSTALDSGPRAHAHGHLGARALVYVVHSGDHLSGVAARFLGDPDRWPELRRAGGITDPDLIRPGQRLVLPDGAHDRGPGPHAHGTAGSVGTGPRPAPPGPAPAPTRPAPDDGAAPAPPPRTPAPPRTAPTPTVEPPTPHPSTPTPRTASPAPTSQAPDHRPTVPAPAEGHASPPAPSTDPHPTPVPTPGQDDDARTHAEDGVWLPSGAWLAAGTVLAIGSAAAVARIYRRRWYRPRWPIPLGPPTDEEPAPAVVRVTESATYRHTSDLRDTARRTHDAAQDSDPTQPTPSLNEQTTGDEPPTEGTSSPVPLNSARTVDLDGVPEPDRAPRPDPDTTTIGTRPDGTPLTLRALLRDAPALTGPGVHDVARALLAAATTTNSAHPPEGARCEILTTHATVTALLPAGRTLPDSVVTVVVDSNAEAIRRLRTERGHRYADPLYAPYAAFLLDPTPAEAADVRAVLADTGIGLFGVLLIDTAGILPAPAYRVETTGLLRTHQPKRDLPEHGGWPRAAPLHGARLSTLTPPDLTAVLDLLPLDPMAPPPDPTPPTTPTLRATPHTTPTLTPPRWPPEDPSPADPVSVEPVPLPEPDPLTGDLPGLEPAHHADDQRPAPLFSAVKAELLPVTDPAAPTDPKPADIPHLAEVPQAPRPTTAVVTLRLLGRPDIIDATGTPVPRLRKLSLAVAADLAVHPDGRTLEQLVTAIDPDGDPAPVKASVRTAINSLRAALRAHLGPPHTKTKFILHEQTHGLYRLDPALIDVDLWQTENAIREATALTGAASARHPSSTAVIQLLTQAAARYRGEFAEGLDIGWMPPVREEYRRIAVDVLTRLAALEEAAGHPDTAIAHLEDAIRVDPVNETLAVETIRIQAVQRRPDAIRRTMKLLNQRLTDAIGGEPSEQTQAAMDHYLDLAGPTQSTRPAR